MKLIIIEGPDNCGKDTLIQKIAGNFPTVTLIHFNKPIINFYSTYEQDLVFNKYADFIIDGAYKNTHCILMNRSIYGEYVYGTIYRKRDEESTAKVIHDWEVKLNENLKPENIKYIQLLSSDINLLVKNDDNKSLSDGKSDLIQVECDKFKRIFDMSVLNKKLIYVNNGSEFRSREDIYNDAINFINK